MRNCGFVLGFGIGDFSMWPITAAHEKNPVITDQWTLRLLLFPLRNGSVRRHLMALSVVRAVRSRMLFFSHHSTSLPPISFALVLSNSFWSRNSYHSCTAASMVIPLGTILPSAKSFSRFSKSLTLDCASDQLRVSKAHLFW